MTHVRRQAPLRREPTLQSLQHAVQHGDQPLVLLGVGVGEDTLVEGSRFDAGGLCGDLADGTHRGRGEVPGAHQRRGGARNDDGRKDEQQMQRALTPPGQQPPPSDPPRHPK